MRLGFSLFLGLSAVALLAATLTARTAVDLQYNFLRRAKRQYTVPDVRGNRALTVYSIKADWTSFTSKAEEELTRLGFVQDAYSSRDNRSRILTFVPKTSQLPMIAFVRDSHEALKPRGRLSLGDLLLRRGTRKKGFVGIRILTSTRPRPPAFARGQE